MTNPIIIFEQDCVNTDDSGRVLDEAYVKEALDYLADDDYPEVTVDLAYEDDTVVVYQGFSEDGESWKFIQVK